jgi:copper resistance protein C
MNFVSVRKLHKSGATHTFFVLALLLAVSAAFAHTHPEKMMPPPDSTVSSPASVMIHFSEALEPKFSSIKVTDAAGHVVNKEPSVVAADKLSMTVPLPPLPPGVYTVNWVGVSIDTHRSQGAYKFTVK